MNLNSFLILLMLHVPRCPPGLCVEVGGEFLCPVLGASCSHKNESFFFSLIERILL